MVSKAYIKSQSLDNISKDPIYDISLSLAEVDTKTERQHIAYVFSKVTELDKRMRLGLKNVVVYKKDNDFVISLKTDDRDVGGRESDVAIYIENGYDLAQRDWAELRKKIEEFAAKHNRDINKSALYDFMAIGRVAKEKKKFRRIVAGGLTILLVVLLALLIVRINGNEAKEKVNNGTRWNSTR